MQLCQSWDPKTGAIRPGFVLSRCLYPGALDADSLRAGAVGFSFGELEHIRSVGKQANDDEC